MGFKLATVSALLLSGSVTLATILPPNDLHLQDNIHALNVNVTEEVFNEIIDRAVKIYAPIIESHGATLKFNRLWDNSTVNASAQQSGSTWTVNMYGGLARRPETTPDGFALVVCHELGHHLAGYPFYNRGGDWAANEGQSDYFATLSCARKMWGDQVEENSLARETVDPLAKDGCDAAWATEEEQNLCYRSAMGGHSLASLLGALGGRDNVSFETADDNQVSRTSDSHPAAQCRLDTYFEGARCDAQFDSTVIPGRGHADGQSSEGAEEVAGNNACSRAAFYPLGNRPRCWFKPLRTVQVNLTDVVWSQLIGNDDDFIQPGETFAVSSSMVNGTLKDFESVDARLQTSSEAVEVIKGESQYVDVAAGSTTEQQSPFEVKINEDATCGQFIELKVSMILGGNVRQQTTKRRLGQIVESNSYEEVETVKIPSKDKDGISREMAVEEDGDFAYAQLKAKFTHSYIGDLTVTLVSPAGEETIVYKKEGGSTDNLELDVEVPIIDVEVAGAWKLLVVDDGWGDRGTLDQWSLKFGKAICE